MAARWPDLVVVLFGSRARRTHRRYSDSDLGVYAAGDIAHREYLRMITVLDDAAEDFPCVVQLVNLNAAPEAMLRRIAPDLCYVTGAVEAWKDLQERTKSWV
ncbi:MAG: nucleotidyltransferase domain-containing protein [Candidatus Hydrogenedentes bacterium]|nr:nucleotidyltransferase domain-containing protein [Candidatus Hydrogenedentota bacterium]